MPCKQVGSGSWWLVEQSTLVADMRESTCGLLKPTDLDETV